MSLELGSTLIFTLFMVVAEGEAAANGEALVVVRAVLIALLAGATLVVAGHGLRREDYEPKQWCWCETSSSVIEAG